MAKRKQPPIDKRELSPSEDEVINAARICHGNVTRMAEVLGLWRGSLQAWLVRHPAVKETVKEHREALKDKILGVFYDNALDPDSKFQASRIFFLKARCGWKEKIKQEVTGTNGAPLVGPQVHVYLPDNGREDQQGKIE